VNIVVQSLLGDMDVLNISRHVALDDDDPKRRTKLHNLSMDLQAVDRIAPALGEWLEQAPEYRVKLLIHNAATLNLGWLRRSLETCVMLST
jgi:hypothetical protein